MSAPITAGTVSAITGALIDGNDKICGLANGPKLVDIGGVQAYFRWRRRAQVAELVDALDSGSSGRLARGSSSFSWAPFLGAESRLRLSLG